MKCNLIQWSDFVRNGVVLVLCPIYSFQKIISPFFANPDPVSYQDWLLDFLQSFSGYWGSSLRGEDRNWVGEAMQH